MMKTRSLSLCLLISLTLLVSACSPPPQGPISASGETPQIFSAFPDASYLLVMHADVPSLAASPFGSQLMEQALGDELSGMTINDVRLGEMVKDFALAVKFNARAFPDLTQAFRWQMALRLTIDMEAVKGFIALNVVEINSYKNRNVYAVNALFGQELQQPVYMVVAEDLLLVCSDRNFVETTVQTLNGEVPSAVEGVQAKPGFVIADKTAPLWFSSQQDVVARNLLQQVGIPAYETMTGTCTLTENLSGALEMSFIKANTARQTALSFDQTMKMIQDFPISETNQEEIRRMAGMVRDSITAEHDGHLAWFTYDFSGSEIQELLIYMLKPSHAAGASPSPEVPEQVETDNEKQNN